MKYFTLYMLFPNARVRKIEILKTKYAKKKNKKEK